MNGFKFDFSKDFWGGALLSNTLDLGFDIFELLKITVLLQWCAAWIFKHLKWVLRLKKFENHCIKAIKINIL